MRFDRFLFAASILSILSAACVKHSTTAPTSPAIAVVPPNEAVAIVRSLTDEVGPRSAGSPGDRAAVAWGLRTMKRLELSNVRAEPVMVRHWQRGVEVGEIVAPSPHRLSLTALGGSGATPDAGIEAEVIEVASLDAIQSCTPAAFDGKIVFINKATARARDGAGYGAAISTRTRGPIECARRGAAAVVIRSIGTDNNRLPHTGITRTYGQAKAIAAAAMSNPDADLVHRLIADGKRVRMRLTLTPQLLEDEQSANVIGEVVGGETPNEIVLIGAHLDSWDLGDGALDDGAGVAIVLAAIREIALQKPPPKRTVRAVLFADEETGARGAKAYAEAHGREPHVVGIEADLGSGAPYAIRVHGDVMKARLNELAQAVAHLGIAADTGDTSGGTDLGPMFDLGMPVIDVMQDATLYFDVHHTANDTFDKIDAAALAKTAHAFAVLARAVAD